MNKVLFIPHTPLQLEAFSYLAESLKNTNLGSICLLITKNLKEYINDSHKYDEYVTLNHTRFENVDFQTKIKYLKDFEVFYSKSNLSIDWFIDRAFQSVHQSYTCAIDFTYGCLKDLEDLFSASNIVYACSEKLFLPQRIIYYLLRKQNNYHGTPIGDRFFKRFYFERDLNEWNHYKILEEYTKLKNQSDFSVSKEVKDLHSKLVFKKYKKVFNDAKIDKGTRVSLLSKILYRLKFRVHDNIYSEYLFPNRSFLNTLREKFQLRRNFNDYQNMIKDKIPQGDYFVYLFHLQPEYTVDGIAMDYFNQVNLVSGIARLLPVNVKLIVKENPRGIGKLNRPKNYYSDLVRQPNIIFLDHNYDSHELLKNSKALITLSGTAGIEAMLFNKPVFVLGDIFYRKFEYFIYVNSFKKLKDTLENFFADEIPTSIKYDLNYSYLVLQAFFNASYPGQMINGFSPNIHRTDDNIELFKEGFLKEINNLLF